MTLRDLLETENVKSYKIIVVQDSEYLQGVNVNPRADIKKILKDKPVQKYLECQIVEKKEQNQILFLKVKVEHKRPPRNFAKTKIKELRLKAGLTQKELAEKSGMDIKVLMAYESGKRNLDNAKLETILNLCIALQCRLEDIIEDENIKEKIGRINEIC